MTPKLISRKRKRAKKKQYLCRRTDLAHEGKGLHRAGINVYKGTFNLLESGRRGHPTNAGMLRYVLSDGKNHSDNMVQKREVAYTPWEVL